MASKPGAPSARAPPGPAAARSGCCCADSPNTSTPCSGSASSPTLARGDSPLLAGGGPATNAGSGDTTASCSFSDGIGGAPRCEPPDWRFANAGCCCSAGGAGSAAAPSCGDAERPAASSPATAASAASAACDQHMRPTAAVSAAPAVPSAPSAPPLLLSLQLDAGVGAWLAPGGGPPASCSPPQLTDLKCCGRRASVLITAAATRCVEASLWPYSTRPWSDTARCTPREGADARARLGLRDRAAVSKRCVGSGAGGRAGGQVDVQLEGEAGSPLPCAFHSAAAVHMSTWTLRGAACGRLPWQEGCLRCSLLVPPPHHPTHPTTTHKKKEYAFGLGVRKFGSGAPPEPPPPPSDFRPLTRSSCTHLERTGGPHGRVPRHLVTEALQRAGLDQLLQGVARQGNDGGGRRFGSAAWRQRAEQRRKQAQQGAHSGTLPTCSPGWVVSIGLKSRMRTCTCTRASMRWSAVLPSICCPRLCAGSTTPEPGQRIPFGGLCCPWSSQTRQPPATASGASRPATPAPPRTIQHMHEVRVR